MKIRCSSINTKIADPISNIESAKKVVEKAYLDKVDMLVFPKAILTGLNCGSIENNKYLKQVINEKELEFIKYCNEFPTLIVCFDSCANDGVLQIAHKGYGAHDQINLYFTDRTVISISKDCDSRTFSNHIVINTTPEAETLGCAEIRRTTKSVLSKLKDCLYITCLNGNGESTTDFISSSYKSICYKGEILAETNSDELTYDFDEDLIKELTYFSVYENECTFFNDYTYSNIDKTPFIPKNMTDAEILNNIVDLQGKGLIQRMNTMHRDKIIMGISGGLDSTVALLSCVSIFKKYNLSLKNIIGITMPGLGTTERTYKNALALMEATGITIHDIDLRPVLNMTIKNLELADDDFGLTYQQTQSRERTQVLLDYANKENGIVIGTGCMSEFALGWMTYGGDHLSMYAIAVGLPKTLVKFMSRAFLADTTDKVLHEALADIIDTPVSPELAPVTETGEQKQQTEGIIGDYTLQDFYLYHLMNNGFGIKKIFNMACAAFKDDFSKDVILNSLEVFVTRFFTRQYKKNCFSEGVKILNYSLSPRTSWKMPGDISNNIWMKEIEEIKKSLKGE